MRTVKRKQPAVYSAEITRPGDILDLCIKHNVPFQGSQSSKGATNISVGQPQFPDRQLKQLANSGIDVVTFEPNIDVIVHVNFYTFKEFNSMFEDLNK